MRQQHDMRGETTTYWTEGQRIWILSENFPSTYILLFFPPSYPRPFSYNTKQVFKPKLSPIVWSLKYFEHVTCYSYKESGENINKYISRVEMLRAGCLVRRNGAMTTRMTALAMSMSWDAPWRLLTGKNSLGKKLCHLSRRGYLLIYTSWQDSYKFLNQSFHMSKVTYKIIKNYAPTIRIIKSIKWL